MIEHYGWREALAQGFAPHAAQGHIPGRVIVQQRGLWMAATDHGDLEARLSGRFTHDAQEADHPAVGDWVALAARPEEGAATIHAVLPRRTAFVRKAADSLQATQVVAANVDVAFLAAALNGDFNPRRLERYLAAAWQSGAAPVVVLTKADLAGDLDGAVRQAEAVAFGAPVLALSALTGEGLAAMRGYLRPGETAVLVGSSGVGKSTLVNALNGSAVMDTGAIRQNDGRGRHTTSHRELIRLPGGALILDTPGMREFGLLDSQDGVAATFADVEAIAGRCRFRDCRHGGEPGCAVREALDDGALEEGRWRSFVKLQRELAHQARRDDRLAREAERKRWMAVGKANRARMRERGQW